MDLIQDLLVVGVAVNRRHQPAFDADRVMGHLRDGREAVGRARRVRNNHILCRERLVIDAEHDGLIDILGRGRDQDPLCPRLQVFGG